MTRRPGKKGDPDAGPPRKRRPRPDDDAEQDEMELIAGEVLRTLGAKFRDARLAAGLTQKDVHERTGVDIPSISRLEAGDANPGVKTLLRLTRAVGMPLADLFPGVPNPDPDPSPQG